MMVIIAMLITIFSLIFIGWKKGKRENTMFTMPEIIAALIIPVMLLFFWGGFQEIIVEGFIKVKKFDEILNKPIDMKLSKLEGESIITLKEPNENIVYLNPSNLYELLGHEIPTIKWYLGHSKITHENNSYLSDVLHYIILCDQDSTLLGFYDYSKFSIGKDLPQYGRRDLNLISIENYKELPGFISLDEAICAGTLNRQAIEKMNSQKVGLLPFIDENNKFAGFIGLNHLNSSLILNILNRLQSGKK